MSVLPKTSPAATAYQVSKGKWVPAKHLLYTSRKLVDATARRTTRLMVTEPPRHGKSELISKHFPFWYLGLYPHHRIILTSYEADFAASWGRKVRDLIDEHGDIFGIKIRHDSSAANRWELEEYGGGMVTAGAGGPITGKGGNVLIIDDPFKNAEQAASLTMRRKIWEWYRSTFYTRLEPGGVIIIIMTRWHEDDLVGRLLNPEMGDVEDWTQVNFPAIAEEHDILGRKPGEALWPQRYDVDALMRIKVAGVGSYWWNAMYQQHPSPPEGNILNRNWWRYYKQAPDNFDEVIQSWDCNFEETDDGSYVVGQVWGKKDADKYLLDQLRARIDFTATLQAIRSLSAKWPQARLKLIEKKANGPAVIATLKREIPGIVPVNPQGSKEARLYAVSPDIEAGNVYIPDPSIATWVHDYVEELSVFPNGVNDDQVDATSQALDRLSTRPTRQKNYSGKGARV